jgi:hypothetical protein
MKDFAGQELSVNDFVALIRPRYRELCLGKITSFTAKKVHVSYQYHFGATMEDHLTESYNLVRLEPTDVLAIKLKGNT